jgi:N-acetylmuramoyl-L-alanine amidase
MNKPEIKWIGSPYFGYPQGTHGRKGQKVIAIVNHIMEGTLAGTDAWFNSAENTGGVSAHFGVGKDGRIHQYVGLNDAARHAGIVKNPSWALLKPDVNPNLYTIGIEHEGFSGEAMPEAQFKATLALHKWLIEIFDLEVNKDTIIGHYRINGVDKVNCPGPGFPWETLFRELLYKGHFPDVLSDHWAAEAVERMAEAGIISGYPDGTFQGDKPVTRYELASSLDRLYFALKGK